VQFVLRAAALGADFDALSTIFTPSLLPARAAFAL
jgi:hypothetical protein